MKYDENICFLVFRVIVEIVNNFSPFLIITKISNMEMTSHQLPSLMFFAFYFSSIIFCAFNLYKGKNLKELKNSFDFFTNIFVLLETSFIFTMFLTKKYEF